MKSVNLFLFTTLSILLLLLPETNAQYPEWAQFTKGDGIRAFADEGNTLWVGTSMGLVDYNKTTGIPVVYNNANSPLPTNLVWTVAVDDAGVKWIGTLGAGIASFDGIIWNIYNTSNSGLINNSIFKIAIDDYGNKWIATSDGISVFDGQQWTTYTTFNSGLPSNYLRDIIIDADNVKWIATFEHGLVRFDGNEWTTFNTSNSDLPDNHIQRIALDTDNDLWLATIDGGLVKFDRNIWTVFNESNSGIPENEIRSLAIDALDIKWIGTGSSGLVKYDDNNWSVYNMSNSGMPSDYYLTAILIDEDDNKYIGTWEGGAVKFNDINWTMINTSNSGIPGNGTYVVEIDHNDARWVGTNKGLARFDSTGWTIFDTSNSPLPSQYVTALYTGIPDTLLIGTNNGFVIYNSINWTLYNTSNSNIPGNNIGDIAVDTNGVIWIALSSGGVTSFNGTTWTNFSSTPPVWTYPFSQVEVEKATNTIWFGSDMQGLVKYDENGFSQVNSQLPGNFVVSLYVDENGTKWIGTGGSGLTVYDNVNWVTYNSANSDLPDNNIGNTVVDSAGIAWIGTGSGLSRFDGTVWTNFNRTNSGLPVDGLTDITIDSKGIKWIGTQGLVAYNESGLIPQAAGIIAGTEVVCEGICEVTYSIDTINNAASYHWTLPPGVTGNSNSNSINVCIEQGSESGNISVYGINEFGNGEPSSLFITVNPVPEKPEVSLTDNILHSGSPEGNQWYDLSGAISGATAQNYTVTETGDYYVVVTTLGCSSVPSDILHVIIINTGIHEQEQVAVYPNPVNNYLVIEKAGSKSVIYYELLTLQGMKIMHGRFTGHKNVNTTSLSNGLYILQIIDGPEINKWKVMKR